MTVLHSWEGHHQNGESVCFAGGRRHLALVFSAARGLARSPVSCPAGDGKNSTTAAASHRARRRMLGGLRKSGGSGCKSTLSRLKWFHGVCVESSPPAFPAPNWRSRCQLSASKKPLPSLLAQRPGPVALGGCEVGSALEPCSPGGRSQTLLRLIYSPPLQGVALGCGTTDLCRSSSRAKCLLVPCVFMFLKVLALIRLGLKIYIKAGAC